MSTLHASNIRPNSRRVIESDPLPASFLSSTIFRISRLFPFFRPAKSGFVPLAWLVVGSSGGTTCNTLSHNTQTNLKINRKLNIQIFDDFKKIRPVLYNTRFSRVVVVAKFTVHRKRERARERERDWLTHRWRVKERAHEPAWVGALTRNCEGTTPKNLHWEGATFTT